MIKSKAENILKTAGNQNYEFYASKFRQALNHYTVANLSNQTSSRQPMKPLRITEKNTPVYAFKKVIELPVG
jgi:hypothetical protein